MANDSSDSDLADDSDDNTTYPDDVTSIHTCSSTELKLLADAATSSEDELIETIPIPPPDGCTSLYLLTSDVSVMAHNEDVARELRSAGAFAEIHVYPDANTSHKETKESFYALTLPGKHFSAAVK